MAIQAKPLSDERLAAIQRRLGRISEPPWEAHQPYHSWEVYSIPRRDRAGQVADPTSRENWPHIATVAEMFDAEFIRCAPDDVRALLAEVDRLRAQAQRDGSEGDQLSAAPSPSI
jgi:hypothetical protein